MRNSASKSWYVADILFDNIVQSSARASETYNDKPVELIPWHSVLSDSQDVGSGAPVIYMDYL